MKPSHQTSILEALEGMTQNRNTMHSLSLPHALPHFVITAITASSAPLLWPPCHEPVMPVLEPHQINVRAIIAMLNVRFQEQPLILPRISPLPILRARWTRNGPLLTLRAEEKRTVFRYVTPDEWLSLLHVTGVLRAYVQLQQEVSTGGSPVSATRLQDVRW